MKVVPTGVKLAVMHLTIVIKTLAYVCYDAGVLDKTAEKHIIACLFLLYCFS